MVEILLQKFSVCANIVLCSSARNLWDHTAYQVILILYLLQCAFVSAHAFNERNREGVQLVCLMCLVYDGKWYPVKESTNIFVNYCVTRAFLVLHICTCIDFNETYIFFCLGIFNTLKLIRRTILKFSYFYIFILSFQLKHFVFFNKVS